MSTQNELDVFGLLISPQLAAPDVFLSSPCRTFPAQAVNTTSPPYDVRLTNSGNAPLKISSIAITGTNSGEFALTNKCTTSLPPGENCIIAVTFSPKAVGPRTAYVTITDSAPGSPHNVYLLGKAD